MKPILMTKLRNELKKLNSDLEIQLSNSRVNGEALGCSGFIRHPDTGNIVYVDTDHNHRTNTKALYRTAKSVKDFTGGTNRYTAYDAEVLAQAVLKQLEKTP